MLELFRPPVDQFYLLFETFINELFWYLNVVFLGWKQRCYVCPDKSLSCNDLGMREIGGRKYWDCYASARKCSGIHISRITPSTTLKKHTASHVSQGCFRSRIALVVHQRLESLEWLTLCVASSAWDSTTVSSKLSLLTAKIESWRHLIWGNYLFSYPFSPF